MNRTLNHLNEQQKGFINAVYVECHTFQNTAALLGVDLPTIRQLNKDLEPIWRPITKVRNTWKSKNIGGSFWDFYHWHVNAPRSCRYCGITQEELNKLHRMGIENKRTTRGRTLEIDRKEANKDYSYLPNLTYCCYWCNNAKTDTFTEAEFELIGQAIGKVWKQRLINDNR
jgi:hypothetical protein